MEVFDAAELWSRDQIEHTQLTRLKATVAHVRKSEFYRRRLDEAGVTPESITSLDDIRRIPFTTKQDLRDQYPTGLLCVPRSEIVRMHCSSGTTGSPVAICHTQNDINSWADLMARCLYMVGVRRDDVFQNMSGYGLFTGGLGIHFGAERLGCMTIPAGPGNSRRQIKLAKDFKTTVAHILPSYALILGEHLRNMGEDPRDFPLRIAVVGAEPYTVEFRRRIEELFDMKAYNSYGLSEMNGPGVAFECQNQNGLHVWEDAYLPEIVDPKTGEPVPDGEIGELVMTCLCRQGMPILRYRDPRPDPLPARGMLLRPSSSPHRPHPGPRGRHVHHQGRQRLSHADRTGHHDLPRSGAELLHPAGERRYRRRHARAGGDPRRVLRGRHALPAGPAEDHRPAAA